MRREHLRLLDIVEAAEAIARFLTNVDSTSLAASEVIRAADVHELAIMGEAAAHVGSATRAAHPSVPWLDIVGFRNFVIHEYFSVDWRIVWAAATVGAPLLRVQVLAILSGPLWDE